MYIRVLGTSNSMKITKAYSKGANGTGKSRGYAILLTLLRAGKQNKSRKVSLNKSA